MIFGIGARSSVAERSAHNRLVAGSNPAEPTSEANPHGNPGNPEVLLPNKLLHILLVSRASISTKSIKCK